MIHFQTSAVAMVAFVLASLSTACAQHDASADVELVEHAAELVCGDQQFEAYVPFLRHRRVAIVANHTSVVEGVHLLDTLRSMGVDVRKIFSPEHGFRGHAGAGEHVDNEAVDDVEVISLYGKNRKPSPEQMRDVDVVLYDLQDVGVRFYTYISTMQLMMEACAEADVPFIVLDRPNPHGDAVDGPVLEAEMKSFVGMQQIPIIYGLTAGELSCMINGEGWIGARRCDLKIVKMLGYDSHLRHTISVSPSPNLRSPEAIWLYPSLCLFEATNVSVGRGTTDPFTVIGAPNQALGKHSFRPEPDHGDKNPLHNGKECFGLDLKSLADSAFTLKYLLQFHQIIGDVDFWKNAQFFDLLAGTKTLRQQLVGGASQDSIRRSWHHGLEAYRAMRQKYLLYEPTEKPTTTPIDWTAAMHSPTVDSLMSRLTLDEQIGQLIWVTLNGWPHQRDFDWVERQCLENQAGGVLIMQSDCQQAQQFIQHLNSRSTLPVIFAIDGENGVARKFSDAYGFPLNLSLGAIGDLEKIQRVGRLMGQQMKVIGLDVNFAPVVDVNTNPRNPIIGDRSFGQDATSVSDCAEALIRGMQSAGVVAVAKHFPGHGDTSTDSHLTLPVVKNSRARIDSIDLMPFRRVISSGAMGVMTAHVAVPALDESGRAASLSQAMIVELLRGEMQFAGLIVTDAMNMAGIKISAGEGKNVETEAMIAGNDVAEFSLNPAHAIGCIKQALADGKIDLADLEMRVRRVLAVKEWCGLFGRRQHFGAPGVVVNSLETELFIDSLFAASVTAVVDKQNLLGDTSNEVYLSLGNWQNDALGNASEFDFQSSNKKVWIFVDDKNILTFNQLAPRLPQNAVVAYAGNPYKLKSLDLGTRSLIIVYENNAAAKRALVNFALYGGQTTATLPVTAATFAQGTGLKIVRHH